MGAHIRASATLGEDLHNSCPLHFSLFVNIRIRSIGNGASAPSRARPCSLSWRLSKFSDEEKRMYAQSVGQPGVMRRVRVLQGFEPTMPRTTVIFAQTQTADAFAGSKVRKA
jgi:hypothetical protein